MKKTVVIGGGLTGLACAYFASRAGHDVTILESDDRVGGLADTFEIGGSRLEKFYHHFFTHDVEFLWLINELGLSDKVKYYDGSMGIYSGGRVYAFNGPLDLLKMGCLSLEDKIRFGLTGVYLSKYADWRKYEGTPVHGWFLKYAGKGATKIIWEPLLKAKFGSYFNAVPVSWMIGRLSQRSGSRKGVKEKLGYPDGSMDVLLKALIKDLGNRNVKINVNSKVNKITVTGNKALEVVTEGNVFPADLIMSTIPTNRLADLIYDSNPEYAGNLRRIEYFGALCFILELTEPLGKYYWLNIAEEDVNFGGVIEHTNLVPAGRYNGSHVVYLSKYFGKDEDIGRMEKGEVEKLMLADLKKIYPGFNQSAIKNTYLFKTENAACVCGLNFSDKVPVCKSPIENLYIVGMPHIYPDERSCNNAVRTAAKACNAAGIDVSYVPKGRSLSGLIGMG